MPKWGPITAFSLSGIVIRFNRLSRPCACICEDTAAAPCSAEAKVVNFGGSCLKRGCDLVACNFGELLSPSMPSKLGANGRWDSLVALET